MFNITSRIYCIKEKRKTENIDPISITPYPTLPIYFLPFNSSTLASLTSHPLRSSPLTQFPILLYSPLPSPPISSLLPSPLIPPSLPYAPISSGLSCSTQRFSKSQRPRCFGTRMYWGRNCSVQNVFWRI